MLTKLIIFSVKFGMPDDRMGLAVLDKTMNPGP